MVKVKVYVEGGSKGKLESKCREGFSEFFIGAGLPKPKFTIIACGPRNKARDRFFSALRSASPDSISLLLVDSEEPVRPSHTPWQHLFSRDQWQRPSGAQEEHAHLMVQCMESWFLADVAELGKYFGSGFRPQSIAKRNDIENIPKVDVLRQLKSASSNSKKSAYDKGRHSFEILSRIDPEKVIRRSPFAKRLVDTLKSHLITS